MVLDRGSEDYPLAVFHLPCFEQYMTDRYGLGWMTRKQVQWVLQVYAPKCWWFKLLIQPGETPKN